MSWKTKFPAEQYCRFHEHWRFVLQRLVFLAAFVVYLETETLVTREAVAEIFGIDPDQEKGFHLDVEDCLSGVLILASELAGVQWCDLGFHEHWRFVLQRLVFLAAFVVYLETETLVTREAVAEIFGSKCLH
ncbi:translin-like isoform X2 [Cebus imitator]|uniref:translin-like isoform X2 n=1 Tax=Cebus imitator TaxID=2715852 RepID=UPI0018974F61|nr:translin-like isoform X2 [Cebus imitator]